MQLSELREYTSRRGWKGVDEFVGEGESIFMMVALVISNSGKCDKAGEW